MGIVKTEYFTDKNDVKMKKEIYENGMTVTEEAAVSEPMTPELTQLDRIEAATEYLMATQE